MLLVSRRFGVAYASPVLIVWLLFAFVAISACSGGFYRISDHPDIEKQDTAEASDLAYVTTHVSLYNTDKFSDPGFTDSKDGDLSHLYVYANFQHSTLGNTSIPLYLIDFKKKALHVTQGAALISKLPLSADARGSKFIKIETRALKTTQFDLVMDIWNNAQDLVSSAAGAVSGGQQILAAVKSAAKLLERFQAAEFHFTADIAIPESYTKQRLSQVYFVLPTNTSGALLPSVAAEVERARKATSMCASSTEARLCESNAEYLNLPYIVLDTTLSRWVDDPQMLPSTISTTCSELTKESVARARQRLGTWDIFSKEQASEENDLLARAEAFLALSVAVQQRISGLAVDQFVVFESIPISTSALYAHKFKQRSDTIRACALSRLGEIPGNEQVIAITKLVRTEVDLVTSPRENLETLLGSLNTFLGTSERPELRFLSDTTLFARAAARRDGISKALHGRFFKLLIDAVQSASQQTSAADQKAESLQRLLDSNCGTCRLESAKVLLEYKNRSLAGAIASIEKSRTDALSEAAAVKEQLAIYSASLRALDAPLASISKADQVIVDIKALQQTGIVLKPHERSEGG